jgi:DNA-binding NtrC family response regulator
MNKSLSVLVLINNPDNYSSLKKSLESFEEVDIRIYHERRVETAISTAKTEEIDVAIIELFVPGSAGLETFISFHASHPCLPTLIMADSVDSDRVLEALQSGAQDSLSRENTSPAAIVRALLHAIKRQQYTNSLGTAPAHGGRMQRILHICSACKSIRDRGGNWELLESYISEHSDIQFSHTLCPDCVKRLYPNIHLHDKKMTLSAPIGSNMG